MKKRNKRSVDSLFAELEEEEPRKKKPKQKKHDGKYPGTYLASGLDEFHRFRIMAIDPATHPDRIGLAVLSCKGHAEFQETALAEEKPRIDFVGSLGPRMPKEMDWRERCWRICRGFEELLLSCWKEHYLFQQPSVFLIEVPVNYHSLKGEKSALSGDLLSLAFTVASISATLARERGRVYEVSAPAWKGQLTKEQVRKRIRKRYGNAVPKDHNQMEALALAYWFLRKRTERDTDRVFDASRNYGHRGGSHARDKCWDLSWSDGPVSPGLA